jgi:hypothetical protein
MAEPAKTVKAAAPPKHKILLIMVFSYALGHGPE